MHAIKEVYISAQAETSPPLLCLERQCVRVRLRPHNAMHRGVPITVSKSSAHAHDKNTNVLPVCPGPTWYPFHDLFNTDRVIIIAMEVHLWTPKYNNEFTYSYFIKHRELIKTSKFKHTQQLQYIRTPKCRIMRVSLRPHTSSNPNRTPIYS